MQIAASRLESLSCNELITNKLIYMDSKTINNSNNTEDYSTKTGNGINVLLFIRAAPVPGEID